MVADLVEYDGNNSYCAAPLEVYVQAERTARQFMGERGHYRLAISRRYAAAASFMELDMRETEARMYAHMATTGGL